MINKQTNVDLSRARHITETALRKLRSYQMPSEVGPLRVQTKVSSLDLSETPVEDSWLIHLTGKDGLIDLRTLNLVGTRITDEGLTTVGKLTTLKQLNLGKSFITSAGQLGLQVTPVGLARLRKALPDCEIDYVREDVKLTEVQAHRIRLLAPAAHVQIDSAGDIVALVLKRDPSLSRDQLEALGKLARLRSLECEAANATAALLEQLTKLPGLRQLVLAHGQLPQDRLQAVSKLKDLETLDLFDTDLDDQGLALLDTLSHLKELNVRRTTVLAAGLRRFREKLPSVKIAFDTRAILGGNLPSSRVQVDDRFEVIVFDFSRVTPADQIAEKLKDLPNLEQLGLRHTKLNDDGMAGLAAMKKLRVVDLGDTRINGSGLKNLSAAGELEKLDLWHTSITDGNLVHLKDLKSLKWLSLAETKIGDKALTHLEGLANLGYLDLRHTAITPEGAQAIRRALPRCKIETFPK
jgi:Leucine-rich repeat (LRR) protein